MKLDTRKDEIVYDTRDRKDFRNGQAFVAGLLRVAKPGTTLHELAKIADAAMTKLAAELPKEE